MSDDEIRGMIRDYSQDLQAFSMAKGILQARIAELEGIPHYESFVGWAGTQAALNSLIMCEVRCQGLIEDLKNNIKGTGTVVQLVKEDEDER